MVLPTDNSKQGSMNDAADADGSFQWISIQTPSDGKSQTKRRLARSHAVKRALQTKRKLEQESSQNFRAVSFKTGGLIKGEKSSKALAAPLCSFAVGMLDPFNALPVNSTRFQMLFGNYKARLSSEPVFSTEKELGFQSFYSVFRTGFLDPALLSAVMLSFAFAVAEGTINRECLLYQGKAISHIREKMSSTVEATSESTIGAILLLAGVEARLGMTSQAQLHLGAVQNMLKICQTRGVYLTDGIKRAIFWQDLNSSILTGTTRIVNHTTFAELQWTRDPFLPTFYRLPSGFQRARGLLTHELIAVLEDIQALHCIRDFAPFPKGDIMLIVHLNNHTASIQSRLAHLPAASPVLRCCYLAAYMCSVMLCCKVWCALVIPSHISLKLLHELQQANDDSVWEDHPDLLLWLLCIGAGFASVQSVRSEYIKLIRLNQATRFRGRYRTWAELYEILKGFIWSDLAFMTPVKLLWSDISGL